MLSPFKAQSQNYDSRMRIEVKYRLEPYPLPQRGYITPFYFGEDSPHTVGATVASDAQPTHDGDELGSPGFDSFGIPLSILDRTLPMLDINEGVLRL